MLILTMRLKEDKVVTRSNFIQVLFSLIKLKKKSYNSLV